MTKIRDIHDSRLGAVIGRVRASLLVIICTGFVTCLAGCSGEGDDSSLTPREGPTPNAAFEAGCEPELPGPQEPARLAESFRGTFGSLSPEGICQSEWQEPVLSTCTEPLAEGVPDMRGLWSSPGHSERVEQCGDLVIISGFNYIHGGYATGRVSDGVNDFRAGSNCTAPIAVALIYEANELQFNTAGLTPVIRRLEIAEDGVDELVWNVDLGLFSGTGESTGLREIARMRRVCTLSDL
ncbi:hypothetical protein [Porticoccus sp.]|uniref:hypothetical protein n=1 Tax=Porticoccus sp. TaxID=2024853 RepID=UPI003F69EEA1